MEQNGNTKKAIIIIFVLIAIGVVGWFGYKYYRKKQSEKAVEEEAATEQKAIEDGTAVKMIAPPIGQSPVASYVVVTPRKKRRGLFGRRR